MKITYLFIHTLLDRQLTVGIFDKKRLIDKIIHKSSAAYSRLLLNLIDKLLKRNRIKFNNLRGTLVVNGPGSFTSIRLGLAAANTLSYFLKIPAVGIKLNEFKNLSELIEIGLKKIGKTRKQKMVLPVYGKSPNITMPTKIL